jgi:hypothetical protein
LYLMEHVNHYLLVGKAYRPKAWVSAVCAATLVGCSQVPVASTTGGIALKIVNLWSQSDPSQSPPDSEFVRLRGPVSRIVRVNPGATDATVMQLDRGSYTVAVAGYRDGSVSVFGQTTDVSVAAGSNVVVAVNLDGFTPVVDSVPEFPGDSLAAIVHYSLPTGAASVVVEWDTLASFGTASHASATGDKLEFQAARYGLYFARVIAVDPDGILGVPSSSITVNLRRVVELDFDHTPNGGALAAGTVIKETYLPWGVTFWVSVQQQMSCGMGGPYANSNRPVDPFTPDFSGNVVSLCAEGTSSAVSEKGFGVIEFNTARKAREFCIGTAPNTPSDSAFFIAYDQAGNPLGSWRAGSAGRQCTPDVGHQVNGGAFSGYLLQLARFDNLVLYY